MSINADVARTSACRLIDREVTDILDAEGIQGVVSLRSAKFERRRWDTELGGLRLLVMRECMNLFDIVILWTRWSPGRDRSAPSLKAALLGGRRWKRGEIELFGNARRVRGSKDDVQEYVGLCGHFSCLIGIIELLGQLLISIQGMKQGRRFNSTHSFIHGRTYIAQQTRRADRT